jgi:hypothetical protein
MQYLVSTLFIVEFLLLLTILIYILFKSGVNFKVGISFALLYFVFIPIWVMIFSGNLELSKADFGQTQLTDVLLNLFIFSIHKNQKPKTNNFHTFY